LRFDALSRKKRWSRTIYNKGADESSGYHCGYRSIMEEVLTDKKNHISVRSIYVFYIENYLIKIGKIAFIVKVYY